MEKLQCQEKLKILRHFISARKKLRGNMIEASKFMKDVNKVNRELLFIKPQNTRTREQLLK